MLYVQGDHYHINRCFSHELLKKHEFLFVETIIKGNKSNICNMT